MKYNRSPQSTPHLHNGTERAFVREGSISCGPNGHQVRMSPPFGSSIYARLVRLSDHLRCLAQSSGPLMPTPGRRAGDIWGMLRKAIATPAYAERLKGATKNAGSI